ncbi:MAG: TIGR02996 domain-containing protein [Kofleriaceae bacterium]
MQLEAVLERWRETRDPKLSDLVITLGGKPDPAVLAPFEKLKPTALVEAVLMALGASKSGGSIASLVVLIDRVVRTARGSWPVVELIAELPADPRIARLGLALLRDFPTLPHTSAKLWRRLLDVVETHGDPTCIAPLQAVQPFDATAQVSSRMTNIAKRLAKHTVLTPAQLEELDQVVIEAPSKNGPALLAAIYADPASNEPREIYADFLMGTGDPRGEFIQLQLLRAAGNATPATEKRELALLRKHGKDWLGPLAGVLVTGEQSRGVEMLPTELAIPLNGYGLITFARGFPRRVGSLHSPKHRAAVLDEPVMATIEHARSVPRITKTMTSLRTIERGRLELIEPGGRTYETFGISLYYAVHDEKTVAAFAGLRARRLELELAWNQAPLAIDVIQAAANGNTLLEEISVENIGATAYTEIWRVRDLKLPNVRRLEINSGSNGFEWHPPANHLDVVAFEGDRERWRWMFQPFALRPFASLRVVNPDSNSGQAALAIAAEMQIAQAIS